MSNRFDEVIVKDREKLDVKPPPMYSVILHNDDYTPMDFVVNLLIKHFNKPFDEAMDIMFNVHEKGIGVAGVYSKDVAETKTAACNIESQSNEHPLLTTMEPVS